MSLGIFYLYYIFRPLVFRDRDVPFVDGSNDYDAEEYDTDESMVDGRNEEELMNERDEASRGSISVEVIVLHLF